MDFGFAVGFVNGEVGEPGACFNTKVGRIEADVFLGIVICKTNEGFMFWDFKNILLAILSRFLIF